MSNAELLEYKRYLQKYVFAGWEAPDDLKEWVRLLERHIMHSGLMEEEDQLPEEAAKHSSKTGSGEALNAGKRVVSAHFPDQACMHASPCQVNQAPRCFEPVSGSPSFSPVFSSISTPFDSCELHWWY